MKPTTSHRILFIFAGILALTALSCSSVANVSNLFATDTPTATSTLTPSPTFTPSPTSTPTQTPSPSPTPLPTGSKTEEQADGSTLFTDYDNQYQLALPKGWMILPLSSGDMADILKGISEQNPEFKDIAETFKNLDPDMIRIMALNMNSKYSQNGFSTTLGVMAIDNKVMSSMPMDFVTGALEESITQQGAQQLSSNNNVVTNANGVEMGILDYQQSVPSPLGGQVSARYKVIVFQAGGKMIMVQLGTPKQFGDQFLPVMDQIEGSVKLIEP